MHEAAVSDFNGLVKNGEKEQCRSTGRIFNSLAPFPDNYKKKGRISASVVNWSKNAGLLTVRYADPVFENTIFKVYHDLHMPLFGGKSVLYRSIFLKDGMNGIDICATILPRTEEDVISSDDGVVSVRQPFIGEFKFEPRVLVLKKADNFSLNNKSCSRRNEIKIKPSSEAACQQSGLRNPLTCPDLKSRFGITRSGDSTRPFTITDPTITMTDLVVCNK